MLYGVFGRVDFSENGIKMRENEEEKLFGRCSVRRMRGKNDSRAQVFSSWTLPPKWWQGTCYSSRMILILIFYSLRPILVLSVFFFFWCSFFFLFFFFDFLGSWAWQCGLDVIFFFLVVGHLFVLIGHHFLTRVYE